MPASVPGAAGASLQPHHGNLPAPAPQSISVDERPIEAAQRVQISVFPRLSQARPLTTVHARLSAGGRENCSGLGCCGIGVLSTRAAVPAPLPIAEAAS